MVAKYVHVGGIDSAPSLNLYASQRRRHLTAARPRPSSSTMASPVRLFDRSKPKHSKNSSESSILPTRSASPRRSPPPSRSLNGFNANVLGKLPLPKRYARLGSIAVWVMCAVSVYYVFQWAHATLNARRKPPLYERYHAYEAALPQHNPNLPAPDGADAKFIWASNHVHGEQSYLLRGLN